MTIEVYLVGIATLFLLFWLTTKLREWYRQAIYRKPLKPEWIAILKRQVPLYSLLPAAEQALLHGHISYFLHSFKFVGRGGQRIDDEVRLTVAGNACMLVINVTRRIYPNLKTIIMYPDTYVANQVDRDGHVRRHSRST